MAVRNAARHARVGDLLRPARRFTRGTTGATVAG